VCLNDCYYYRLLRISICVCWLLRFWVFLQILLNSLNYFYMFVFPPITTLILTTRAGQVRLHLRRRHHCDRRTVVPRCLRCRGTERRPLRWLDSIHSRSPTHARHRWLCRTSYNRCPTWRHLQTSASVATRPSESETVFASSSRRESRELHPWRRRSPVQPVVCLMMTDRVNK